jgi:ribosomal protein S18 acetylase RimI-like enzyme
VASCVRILDGPIDEERRSVWVAKLTQLGPQDHVTLLLEEAEQLVGFVSIVIGTDETWGSLIDNLHVAAGRKGRGCGRYLLEAAARVLIERRQLGPLYLWVFEANRAARRFYARMGGAVVEKSAHLEPDGSAPLAVRYVWSSAKALLDSAISGAQSAVSSTSGDASAQRSGSDTGS